MVFASQSKPERFTWGRTASPRGQPAKRRPGGLHTLVEPEFAFHTTTDAAPPPLLQPKLKIGAPNDRFEREADRVAEEVLRISDPSLAPALVGIGGHQGGEAGYAAPLSIRMMCARYEDEIGSRAPIRRVCSECAEREEEELHRVASSAASSPTVTPALESRTRALTTKGQPLSTSERAFFEPRFGVDLSGVRLHTDANAARSAREIGALAYTTGRHIVFDARQYAPSTAVGRRLLAHELAHVIQQQSRVGHRLAPGAGSPASIRRQPLPSEREEAAFAVSHPGEVEDVGATEVSDEPNEFLFWNFLVGSPQLRAQHRVELRRIADRWRNKLKERSDLRIKIIGAASQTGSTAANEKLARRRAEATRDFLRALNVPVDRIEPVGVGNREPLADPTSAKNLARNRRVEVFLFTPVTEVQTLGRAVQPEVLGFAPSFLTRSRSEFRENENLFTERMIGAAVAFALVRLTGPPDSEMGMLQFLTEDVRVAVYNADLRQRRILHDFGRCSSPFLPCRDVEEATNRFSLEGPGRTVGPTGEKKLLVFRDSPGYAAGLRIDDPSLGRATLVGKVWRMEFALILGARLGTDFQPLEHVVWRLDSVDTVDVANQAVIGSPLVRQVSSGKGAPPGLPIDRAMSHRTCRFLLRRIDRPGSPGVCVPTVIRS